MTDVLRPQPPGIPWTRPGMFSAPYWEGASQSRLLYQRCQSCGHLPRRPFRSCGACRGGRLEWLESSGRGRLYSWTVVWRPQHPAFRVPYAPVVVAVEEGWWLLTAMIGCVPEDLREGMAVQVEFHPAGEGQLLAYARPVDDVPYLV